MKICFLFVLIAAAWCTNGPMTEFIEGMSTDRAAMHLGDIIFDNPHLKSFETKYFINPSLQHQQKLVQLAVEMGNLKKNMKNDFQFAGYNSLDTNLYNRFVKENLENDKYRQIGSLLEQIRQKKDKMYPTIPAVNPAEVAEVKFSIKQIDKARENNELRLPHSPMFVRPYEDGKEDMVKLTKRIEALSANLRKPLEAPEPTQQEIATLRSLDEKMARINKRIHSLPAHQMEEHILVQSQELSSLVDMLRRMSNAIDEEHREAFLYRIHGLLHRHHLHDHPMIKDFEHELARSIATGNRFTTHDIRLPAPYAANQSYNKNYAKDITAYENARHYALQKRNLDEAARAHNVASDMKGRGRELVDKAKEMRRRAEMMERTQSVPAGNQQAVASRLRAATY